jgi:hypothetical protein
MKALLISVAVIELPDYRLPQQLPSQSMCDRWCYIDSIKAYRRGDCLDGEWMSVDEHQQRGHEWGCSVKQIWRLIKGRTYRIDLKCEELEQYWDERTILSLSTDKKILYSKSERRSKLRNSKSED